MIIHFHRRYSLKKFSFTALMILTFSISAFSQKIRILPLGDSITRDCFNDDPRPDSLLTGYRQSLWLLLHSAGYNIDFVGSDSSGHTAIPRFDPDNAGFGGYSAKQLLHLIKTGYDVSGSQVTPGPYLNYYPADIILLHIGTNELDTNVTDVENLLNYINDYEDSTNTVIWVILAKIINEVPYNVKTTIFNNNIEKMAEERIKKGDHLKIVDMEKNAGLVYKIDTAAPYENGDMYDKFHPNKHGYKKMASLYYDTLKTLLNKIIPVEFAGISYLTNKNNIILFWQTDMEISNYGFEIERDMENNGWQYLGFIKGANDSHKLRTYYFIDSSLEQMNKSKTCFYRLKRVKKNGRSITLAEFSIDLKNKIQVKNHLNKFIEKNLTTYDISDESKVNTEGYVLSGQESSFLTNNSTKIKTTKKIRYGKKLTSELFFYILNTIFINDRLITRFSWNILKF